jgi:Co/Zn/Cd efflux system component
MAADPQPVSKAPNLAPFHRAVQVVAGLNLVYFLIEAGMAQRIHAVSLFADSIDFLEDASMSILVLVGMAWSLAHRARLGRVLALMLAIPSLLTVWTLWHQFGSPVTPDASLLALTGLGALVVNLYCAWRLLPLKNIEGSLSKAACLASRNDAIGNIAILIAAGITWWKPSHWPDLVVGVGIFLMNADASLQIWKAAHIDDGASATKAVQP